MSDEELTPVDRPMMRSDLNDVRDAVHRLSQTVLDGYNEARRARAEPRVLTVACLVCALVSIGSAIVSLETRAVVLKAAHAAEMRP
jgi:hypothetical protein